MCSLLGTNIGVDTKEDYEQYSDNLKKKKKDKNLLISLFFNDNKRQCFNKCCLKHSYRKSDITFVSTEYKHTHTHIQLLQTHTHTTFIPLVSYPSIIVKIIDWLFVSTKGYW